MINPPYFDVIDAIRTIRRSTFFWQPEKTLAVDSRGRSWFPALPGHQ